MNTSRLFVPALGSLYVKLANPSIAILRIIAGLALVTHGYGKIMQPMGNIDFLESIGFWPGEFWSPLLACTEFFGGLLLAIGFLTRPAALFTTIVLLVTVWFHWIVQDQGYGGSEKSILWAAITFYFFIHGGQHYALDKLMKREF